MSPDKIPFSLRTPSPRPMKHVRIAPVDLKASKEINEVWIHDRIAEDPSILGLGDVAVRDRERLHPGAGRLDMLLQDTESAARYEVEIQLGATDPSHIIRTLEYWDIERKRFPQYEHIAVIIAEDITSRFLNVIGLFNGSIPIIAIQMRAVQMPEGVGLIFTKVLDATQRGLEDEDEEARRGDDVALETVAAGVASPHSDAGDPLAAPPPTTLNSATSCGI